MAHRALLEPHGFHALPTHTIATAMRRQLTLFAHGDAKAFADRKKIPLAPQTILAGVRVVTCATSHCTALRKSSKDILVR